MTITVWEASVAAIVALPLTLIVAVLLRRPGPWGSAVNFFLLVFLGAWAGGQWTRVGGERTESIMDALPFLIAGVIAAVILALIPAPGRQPRPGEPPRRRPALQGLSLLFWLLAALLAGAIAAAYLAPGALRTTLYMLAARIMIPVVRAANPGRKAPKEAHYETPTSQPGCMPVDGTLHRTHPDGERIDSCRYHP